MLDCCDEYGGGGMGANRDSCMVGWEGGLEKGCCAECRGSIIAGSREGFEL